MLSEADLRAFRSVANEVLPDTGMIVRTEEVSDNSGGTIPSTTIIATKPCRLSPQGISYSERERPQGEQTFQAWYLTFPYGTDVILSDTVSITGKGVYEVLGMDKDRSYGVSLRMSVGKISG